MKNIILFFVIAFLFWACAFTDITSVVDQRTFKGPYSNLLIISNFDDLQFKKAVEAGIKAELNYYKILAWASLDLIPPTRQYSDKELLDIFKEYNIDAILVVAFKGYWESQAYIPPSTTTTGGVSIVGNTINYAQRTNYYGGYNVSKPRVDFESRLFDARTGTAVWMSSSTTRGNAFANFSTLAVSLSTTTVNKLKRDGIVIKGQPVARGPADSPWAENIPPKKPEQVLTRSTLSKATIIKKDAALRIYPDEKSEVIMVLPLGAFLDVEELSGAWVRIKLPPNKDGIVIIGYVHISELKF